MSFKFDTRGFPTVSDLRATKELFTVLEKELKNVNKRAYEEYERDAVVENEEDHYLLGSTLCSLEQYSEEQEQSLRATEIIRLFVIVEGHLKTFCKAIRSDKKLSLGVDDFHGDLIKRSKLFLCGYAGIIENQNSVWLTVHGLQKMRNHLVHSAVDRSSGRDKRALSDLANRFNRYPDLIKGKRRKRCPL